MHDITIIANVPPRLHSAFAGMSAIVEAALEIGFRTMAVEGLGPVQRPRDRSDRSSTPVSEQEKTCYLIVLARAVTKGHSWIQLRTEESEGVARVVACDRHGRPFSDVHSKSLP